MNNIGILDPDGINKNPLTGQDYTDKYRDLGKIWSNFPANKRADEILKTLNDNQVTIITSGTGSGKTVLMPKFLLHLFGYEKLPDYVSSVTWELLDIHKIDRELLTKYFLNEIKEQTKGKPFTGLNLPKYLSKRPQLMV